MLSYNKKGDLQAPPGKFIKGDALELYPNEIRRVDAVEWKAFPKAFVVSDGMLRCDRIEDSIQERMGRAGVPGGKNDGMGSKSD